MRYYALGEVAIHRLCDKTLESYDWAGNTLAEAIVEEQVDKYMWTKGVGFVGYTGVGKCVSEDTYLQTSEGLLMFKEVYNENVVVSTETGGKKVSDWYFEGKTKSVNITTKLGVSLKGRGDHRVRVLVDGIIEWRKLSDTIIGDTVIVKGESDVWGSRDIFPLGYVFKSRRPQKSNIWDIPVSISDEWCEFFGYLLGDGCVWNNCVGLSVTDELLGRCVVLFRKIFQKEPSVYLDRRSGKNGNLNVYDVRITCSNRVGYLRWLGFGQKAGDKVLPKFIRQLPKVKLCKVIRGYFDTDGWMDGSPNIMSKSGELLHQVHLVLLALGIETKYLRNKSGYFHLRVQGLGSKERFLSNIGFGLERKQKKLVEYIESRESLGDTGRTGLLLGMFKSLLKGTAVCSYSGLRGSGEGNYIYKSLSKVVERLELYHKNVEVPQVFHDVLDHKIFCTQISSIEEGEIVAYDLTSGFDDPTYVANGLVTHNTHLLISLYKERMWRAINIDVSQLPVWMSFNDIIDTWVDGKDKESVLDTISKGDIVFIDDLFSQGLSDKEQAVVREIVFKCYDSDKVLCFTSNILVDNMDIDARVKDRLKEMVTVTEIIGESRR